MAELTDILKIVGHDLIIQSVDVNKQVSRKDTTLNASMVKKTIKRAGQSKFYFVKLDLDEASLSFDKLDVIQNTINIPTVYPKSFNGSDVGYTCSSPSFNDSGLHIDGQSSDIESAYFQYGTCHIITPRYDDYRDAGCIADNLIFLDDDDFDSNSYIQNNELKIVNAKVEGTNNYKLHFYNEEGEVTVFDNDNNSVEDYTLVTLIPIKSPLTYGAQNPVLKYVLCQFVRGSNVGAGSGRTKYEWSPLEINLNGTYKSVFTTVEVDNLFSNRYNYIAYPDIEPYNPQKQTYTKISEKPNCVYRIQTDTETGQMYDNRNTDDENDNKILFLINGKNAFNTPKYGRYVYGLRTTQSAFGDSIDWSSSFMYQKLSVNSEILVVKNGDYTYPLYSKRLLTKYGIGFIISDWLYYKDGKYIVRFNPKWLKYWLPDAEDTIIEDSEIYSLKYIYDNLQPTSEDEPIYNHYNYLINRTDLKARDIWTVYPGDEIQDKEIMSELMFSRTYIGTPMKTYENGVIKNVYPSVGDDSITFVTYHWNDWYERLINKINLNLAFNTTLPKELENKSQTIFTRYNISKNVFDSNNAINLGPSYDIITSWVSTVNKKNCLAYLIDKAQDTNYNEYNEDTLDTSYSDYQYLTYYVENNNYVYLQIKYLLYQPKSNDIYNKDEIYFNCMVVGDVKKIQLKYTDTGIVSIDEAEVNQLIDAGVKSGKYITPMKFYGNQQIVYGENEIPINENQNEIKWFWLDTLKNWCRYEKNIFDPSNLLLKCWNGVNGWDNVTDIVGAWLSEDYSTLLINYLYTNKFFQLGAYYGLNGESTFAPIKYNNGYTGIMSYMSLILFKDYGTKNYNNFMQSLHRSKTYMNGEINAFSNYSYYDIEDDVHFQLKINGQFVPLKIDEDRPAIFGVSTQYCPTVLRLANGNLSIMFRFQVPTNGYANGTMDINLISADNATNACIELFGDGNDKTMYDWKHYNSIDTSEESTTQITTGDNETLYNVPTLTLIENDDKINNITLTTNRPNPTTQGYNEGDFLERWDR